MNHLLIPSVKYPIGIQSFEKLRNEGFVYVDKTSFVYELTNGGNVFFLGRPRRFGKSLFLSTLEAYFLGKKELFEGLVLADIEKEWKKYPVLRMDLNAENYDTPEALTAILNNYLCQWESQYGSVPSEQTLSLRFKGIISRAHLQTGLSVVVLVDEYDKPLLQAIGNEPLADAYRAELKAFYGVLKSSDEHLKFVFLTGVTKFSQVSVFSDLNHLEDISLDSRYATICGITQEELESNFVQGINALAAANGQTKEETLEALRLRYNGYHFSETGASVYNPFSTLNVLKKQKYLNYWFQTGTPTFLLKLLKDSDYDLRDLEGEQLYADDFADYRTGADRPIPVIYQSGYLTIKDFDPVMRSYTLGFPNDEVKYGFLNFLLPSYTGPVRESTAFYIGNFVEELRAGNVDAFLTRLRSFFGAFPYELNDKTERHYQVVFYLVFKLLGQFIDAEVQSAKGRADAVVKVPGIVYVFEFKLDGTPEEALQQIDDKGYLIPYKAGGYRLVKVGVSFSKTERNIGKWVVI